MRIGRIPNRPGATGPRGARACSTEVDAWLGISANCRSGHAATSIAVAMEGTAASSFDQAESPD
eukprot:scaffold1141_cov128-Isochrysis_galbana.AAC.2